MARPANTRRSNGNNLFAYCLNAKVNENVNGTGDENKPVRHSTRPQPATLVWLFDSKNLPAFGYWGFVHTNLHAVEYYFMASRLDAPPASRPPGGRAVSGSNAWMDFYRLQANQGL